MNKVKFYIMTFVVSLFGLEIMTSCVKEEDFNTDSSFQLEFSTNELLFDTVFTTLGSTTKQLMVYNRSNKPIKIASVRMSGGNASAFRINVDGSTSEITRDVEIAAKDSMYIFANVTISPNSSTSPFIVKDSIEFLVNNKYQYLSLVAFGQNAIYHYPNHKRTLPNDTTINYSYANCQQPWNNTLPHVIYDYCLVDKDSTLTIEEGTKIYFYNKSTLLVYDGGSLKVNENGQFGNPVVFQSMRKDEQYKDLPGQWNSIHFMPGSVDNIINWTIIRNGTTGLEIDSCANTNPTVTVSNTIIENMSHAGIYAKTAKIQASNLLVTNCQNYILALTRGGDYTFTHCTFADYWGYSTRNTPSLLLNNWIEVDKVKHFFPLTAASFTNCIIYGSRTEELGIDLDPSTSSSYQFIYCLLKTLKSQDPAYYTQCSINNDPKFVDIGNNNYHLGAGSAAIGRGYPPGASLYLYDLDNIMRESPPSIGAYEYVGSGKKR